MSKKRVISKICPICEKIHKGKRSICQSCAKKIHEIEKRAHSKYRISISKINSLRNIYKQRDILEYLLENPQLIYIKIDSKEAKAWLRYRKFQLQENLQNKEYKEVPLYVKQFFLKNKGLGFINIVGNKEDPFIIFTCKKCHEEYIMHYSNIVKGSTHICDSNISSGEFIVKEYFNVNKYKYKTQFDTLACTNPKTGRILPYDFELPAYKILIEVQGEQHCEYNQYFHNCFEDFKYQVFKDRIKKEFAEKKGYQLVYLYYKDFKSENYKKIIQKAIINSNMKNYN